MQHLGYSDIMVAGCNKQNFICHYFFFEGPHLELNNIAFHFSDFGLSLDPVLHGELVFLPSSHLTVGVSGGTMSQPSKRPRLLQHSEISELIVDTDRCEA